MSQQEKLAKWSNLEWVDKYLKEKGFWFADFGNYCFGKNENTVGISVHCEDEFVYISTIKFPECQKSPPLVAYTTQTGTIKSMLDTLIFTIKQYEEN